MAVVSDHPIDLHILRSDGWPSDLFARALASTEEQPVNVHVVPWDGSLGASRAHGYRQGSAPYVAFLDADDELIPGGMDAMLAALEADASLCGVYGGEERVHEDGTVETRVDTAWSPVAQLTNTSAQHNAILMRRAAVMPHLEEMARYPIRSNRLLRGLITQSGPWAAVPVLSYRWYLRPGTLRTLHRSEIDLAITRRLAPILMARAARRES